MITITEEQVKELEGIYHLNHKCKDNETKKLVKSLLQTLDIDWKNFKIDSGYFYYPCYDAFGPSGNPIFKMDELKKIDQLPIVVILYLITRDEKYLKPSKYVKGSIKHKGIIRNYIKFSNICYFIDRIYGCLDSSKFFKIEQ